MDTTKLNTHNPTHFHMVMHWLLSHFSGTQAIVFLEPKNHIESISKRFGVAPIQLIHSEIFVLPTEDPKAMKLVDGLSVEEFGPAMLWDKQNFWTENT
jgi:hypothetical protein